MAETCGVVDSSLHLLDKKIYADLVRNKLLEKENGEE